MDYQKIYTDIINKRKLDPASNYGYSENHHIIPRSLGGSDEQYNIVSLTAKEHFICHLLLVKINYNHTGNMRKMIYALNIMCSSSDNQSRYTSRMFEKARMLFSMYHPTQDENVKNKISNGLKKYYSENKSTRSVALEERICECGCGEKFEVKPYDKKRFLNKSHALSARDTTKMVETLKKTLNSMSDDDMKKRLTGFMNTDPKKRGESISNSKKGVKTNQKLLEEIKYGIMSDQEFNDAIKDMHIIPKGRMTNRRKVYLDNVANGLIEQYIKLKD